MAVNAGGLRPSDELPGFPTDSFLAFALAVPFIQGALFSTMNAGDRPGTRHPDGFRQPAVADRACATGRCSPASSPASSCSASCRRLFYLAVGLVGGVDVRVRAARGSSSSSSSARSCRSRFGALGSYLALATGSGEAIQGALPAVLRLPLHLLDELRRASLIEIEWFRIAATLNPVSYLIECVRSLIITGWDSAGARARLRLRDRAGDRLARARRPRAPDDG